MQLTFEMLPDAVSQLFAKLENIERLLLEPNQVPSTPQSDDLITVRQAADFINLTVPTIYGLVSRREIPAMKKGKRLYFSKSELKEWIRLGRKQTLGEIQAEAETFLSTKKKGGGK